MSNTDENIKDIKELADIYDRVLKHLELLKDYTLTDEDCFKNKDLIIELNETHKITRERGKVLFSKDLTKLSNNFFYKLISKDLKTTSIQFINIVTDFTEEMVGILNLKQEEVNKEVLSKLRKNIFELNKISQSQFKGLKNKLVKLSEKK